MTWKAPLSFNAEMKKLLAKSAPKQESKIKKWMGKIWAKIRK